MQTRRISSWVLRSGAGSESISASHELWASCRAGTARPGDPRRGRSSPRRPRADRGPRCGLPSPAMETGGSVRCRPTWPGGTGIGLVDRRHGRPGAGRGPRSAGRTSLPVVLRPPAVPSNRRRRSDHARRVAGAWQDRGVRPAMPSPSSCRTASRPPSSSGRGPAGRRGRAHRPLLRRQGGRLHPAPPSARVLVTADRFGPVDYLDDPRRAGARPARLDRSCGRRATTPAPAPSSSTTLLRPSPSPALGATRTEPAFVAYTWGTTADPKGVIHTHRSIGAEISQLGDIQPGYEPADAHRGAGRPRHRDARRAAPARLPRPARRTSSTCWNPAGDPRLHGRSRPDRRARRRRTSSASLDHPDFGRRTRRAHAPHRPRRLRGPGRSADRASASASRSTRAYGSTEHPSITGSQHDQPQDKRIEHRRPADVRRRDAHRRRGRRRSRLARRDLARPAASATPTPT